jgi:uncharacterized protein (DUF302 family)
MEHTKQTLGLQTKLNTDLESAQAIVAEALKAEGFGILTEIDVKATLKKKIDVDFHPYKILGACNPALAHQALMIAPEIGLLLPCNVIIAENEMGKTDVSLINPLMMMGVIGNPDLETIAQEAQERLERVRAALEAQS